MSTAEWGVALGIVGSITGTASLFWRMFEWWDQRTSRLTVTGSAGRSGKQGPQPVVLFGKRFGPPDLVTVTIICKGRTTTVTKAGFLRRRTGVRYHISPLYGNLPSKLERGESLSVVGNAATFVQAVEAIDDLEPYCVDAEGGSHFGKNDDHFTSLGHYQSFEKVAE